MDGLESAASYLPTYLSGFLFAFAAAAPALHLRPLFPRGRGQNGVAKLHDCRFLTNCVLQTALQRPTHYHHHHPFLASRNHTGLGTAAWDWQLRLDRRRERSRTRYPRWGVAPSPAPLPSLPRNPPSGRGVIRRHRTNHRRVRGWVGRACGIGPFSVFLWSTRACSGQNMNNGLVPRFLFLAACALQKTIKSGRRSSIVLEPPVPLS